MIALLLSLALAQTSAHAKLVPDHSEFTGTYNLVDGNVKNCQVKLTLEGQPNALVINGFTIGVTTAKPSDVPVGTRMQLAQFNSDAEFVADFVDNIDVPNTLVQIVDTYRLLGNGALDLVITNDHPSDHFSAPARVECKYQLDTGY
jgi:hypothetical protein